MKQLLWIPILALISGCSYMPDWMGAEDEERLSGERLAVLPDRQVLAADPVVKDRAISLPEPQKNIAWYQGQAVAEDNVSSVYNIALRSDLKKVETYSDASAPDEDVRLTSTPVVVGNLLVLLDGQGRVTALSVKDPDEQLWQVDLRQLAVEARSASGREAGVFSWFAGDEDFIGGNISYVDGRVIATTGNGHVFALEASTGRLLWQRAMGISIQSTPSGRNGTVYFVTSDNQLYALSLKDGSTLWTDNGVPQQTKIFGAPAPVALQEMVIVPYSSGQLVALKQVNGFKLWEENLDKSLRVGALGYQFTDIMAAPVVYGGRVFASAEGHLVSLDLMTGTRIWELPITLSSTPWLAGEWLFGVTNQEELVAVHAGEGKIRWVTPLPLHADPDSKKEHIRWSGPVLAGGKLVVVGSKGELKTFAVDTGALLDTIEVEDNILLPPIVENGRVFLFSNEADLSILE